MRGLPGKPLTFRDRPRKRGMHQFAARALLFAICMLPAAAPILAQTPVPPPAPQAAPQSDAERFLQDSDGARATRMRLQQLLRQYPPAVGEVLQRDPSLMNRPDYL